MAFELVVFDLDGTLVDSRRDIADAANALLEEAGAPPLPEERIGRMVGDGAAVLVARAFAAVGRPAPADALARFIRQYDRRLVAHTRPYDGVPGVLERVATRSRLAVLTNKPLAAARSILDALDLARFFDPALVVGGDGPLARKPDPAGVRHLAERVGAVLTAVAMVGDSVVDWRTAHAAGTAICVAAYGFGFATFPVGELQAADCIAQQPCDLLRWL